MRKIIFTAVLFLLPALASGDYVPSTRKRVTDGAVPQYYLVKMSTTSGRVTLMAVSDAAYVLSGVAQTASAGTGNTIQVQELQGLQTAVVSDGVFAINPGDIISPSTTTAGQVTKSTNNPICTAVTAAVAVAGTVFQCL